MLRLLSCAGLAALLVPSTAAATPFGELPFAPVPGAATCLRATGAPGELARSSPSGVRFLQATAAGVADAGGVTTGIPQGECPQVAARPSGAGVVAQAGSGLWVATRDPGGGWTTPVKLAEDASHAAVAVSDSGAAVAAWLEPGSGHRFTVKAARRAPGGAFAAAVALGAGRNTSEYLNQASVRAATGADGEAIVLWTQPPADAATRRLPVLAAIAPAAGAFGAAQRIGDTQTTSAPALAAATDGRALAAFWTGDAIRVAERPPGGAFAAPATVGTDTDAYAVTPAAAIGSGGGAVVAWQSVLDQGVSAVARATSGAFGTPTALASDTRLPGLSDALRTFIQLFASSELGPLGVNGVAPDADGGDLRAALTADGRALLTWTDAARSLGPRAATFPLAGGHVDRGPLGTAVRESSSLTPLALAGGAPAVAWTDNRENADGGRVHVAVEGAAPVGAPPAPRVTLGAPRDAVLNPRQALELPVACSAACEVRVDLPDRVGLVEFVSLSHEGRTTASFEPDFGPVAPLRRVPERVRLRFSAPGAGSAVERIETVTVRRLPSPPTPHVRGLKAVRHGSGVDVSWRTDIAADTGRFTVFGTAGRDAASPPLTGAAADRAGTRRFTARLPKAGKVKFVTLIVENEFSIAPPIVVRVIANDRTRSRRASVRVA